MMQSSDRRKTGRARVLRKGFTPLLIAIVAVSLLLRVGVSRQLRNSYPQVARPSQATDMHVYQMLAMQVLNGSYKYGQGFYYQPFYYVIFLPAIYAILGADPAGVILVQSVLGALCVYLIGMSAARLFGRAAGLAGAALLALSRFHIFYTPFTLIEILLSFWLTLFLYLGVAAYHRKRLWPWVLDGLVLGISVTIRGSMVTLLLPVLAMVAWQFRHEKVKMSTGVLLCILCTYLPQLPFAVVNYRCAGRWVGAVTSTSRNLALANTPESPPGCRDPEAGAGPMEYTPCYEEWTRLDALPNSRRVPISISIQRWFIAEPLAFLELKFRMLLLFWNKMEIPNNVAIRNWNHRTGRLEPVPSPLLHMPFLLDFPLIGGLGLAGALLALRQAYRKPGIIFAEAVLWLYCMTSLFFLIMARYRVVVLPVICGFGGYGIAVIVRRFVRAVKEHEHERERAFLRAVIMFMSCVAFVGFGYDAYRYGCEAAVVRYVRPHGVCVELLDRYTLKDSGPFPFGGWQSVELPAGEPALRVRKLLAPGSRILAEGPLAVRLPIFSQRSCLIAVRSGSAEHCRIRVEPGLKWIEYPLPPEQSEPLRIRLRQGDSLKLELSIAREGPASAYCFFDGQRTYGRTDVSSAQAYGEMVIELVIFKKAKKA